MLQEESGIANEIFVVLKGNISYYRKTPKQADIIVKNRDRLVELPHPHQEGFVPAFTRQNNIKTRSKIFDESSSSNDDLISMDSDQAREKKAKEKEKVMASLIKERPFKK